MESGKRALHTRVNNLPAVPERAKRPTVWEGCSEAGGANTIAAIVAAVISVISRAEGDLLEGLWLSQRTIAISAGV